MVRPGWPDMTTSALAWDMSLGWTVRKRESKSEARKRKPASGKLDRGYSRSQTCPFGLGFGLMAITVAAIYDDRAF